MTTTNDLVGLIGQLSLYAAVGLCVLNSILSLIFLTKQKDQLWNSIHTGLKIQTTLMVISVLSLTFLLQRNAFEYNLVFESVEIGMPWYQKLGGLWSGQASSLMFFSLIFSFAVYGTFKLGQRLPEWRMGILAVLILTITLVFFLVPPAMVTSPFQKIWLLSDGTIGNAVYAPEGATLVIPADGRGLTPSLRHIAMLLHPPFLYLGLIGFFIPYALSIAALVYRPEDIDWVKITYPLVLVSWICLTLGMFLGSWWAYSIQGWGGYWGWDAVEISGLLPWLLSFGLLHSMQAFIHGRPFKRWTYVLTSLIFLFVLLGILITRSGILDSVHAYTSGTMGPVLTGLLLAHVVLSGLIHIKNRKSLKQPAQETRRLGPDQLLSGLNSCLIILVLIYLFGQTLPITSPLFNGIKTSFSATDYESLSAPFLLLILLFTALFPSNQANSQFQLPKTFRTGLIILSVSIAIILLFIYPIGLNAALGYGLVIFLFGSWFYLLVKFIWAKANRTFSGKFDNINLGMILVHIGLALFAFGILGVENFTSRYEVGLQVGAILNLDDWNVSAGSRQISDDNDSLTTYEFELKFFGPSGRELILTPKIESYPKLDMLNSVPAIHSNLRLDVHTVMTNWEDQADHLAKFQISFIPFMAWIWIGGMVMISGGLVSFIADKQK